MAKTNTSKNKKTSTAVRKVPATITPKQWNVIVEQLKYLTGRVEQVGVLANNVAEISDRVADIRRTMDLDRAAPQEEQGLEDGDYTDASKEVADALTAMGYEWVDTDRFNFSYITWHPEPSSSLYGKVVSSPGRQDNKLTNADFLSRARVTAKKLGLVPVDPSKIKEEEQKLSRMKFGTRVSVRGMEGRYHYNDGDSQGNHWVVFPDGASTNFSIHELTIID